MTTRREFIMGAGAGLAVMGAAGVGNGTEQPALQKMPLSSDDTAGPLVVSTWRHGVAANEAAWKILDNGGRSLDAVEQGVDLFDCVIPTRFARSATAFTSQGKIRLTHRRYRRDAYPIDTSCDCSTCAGGFSRAYLNHLFAANEVLSAILLSFHNVRFYERLVQDARQAILDKNFETWRAAFLENYGKAEAEHPAKTPSSGSGVRKKKHRKGTAK